MDKGSSTLDLADAFNDLLFSGSESSDYEMNDVECHVYDRVNNILLGTLPLEDVPKLPASITVLLKELDDPEVHQDRLVELINNDPGLAGDVLKLANSAYFRRSETPISSIEQALVMLGHDTLKSMASTILLQPIVKIKPIYFKLFGKTLWDHSMDCAMTCRNLAARFDVDKFAAYLLGLVHDVGKIVIFHLLIRAYKAAHPDISPRPVVFKKIMADKAAHLAQLILKNWEFPVPLLAAVSEQQKDADPDALSPLGRTLYVGNLISEANILILKGRYSPQDLTPQLEHFGIAEDLLAEMFPAPQLGE